MNTKRIEAPGNSRIPTTAEMQELGITRETLPEWCFANLTRREYEGFMAGWRDAQR